MSELASTRVISSLRRAHLHEIRGALNALRLHLTLLQRGRETGADDERMGRWLAAAVRDADALERTVEEFGALDTIDRPPTGGTPRDVVTRVASLLAPLAKTQRIHLVVDTEAATGFDAAGLARPLLRLATRCLVAGAPGGTMTLRLAADGVEITPGLADDAEPAGGKGVESSGWTLHESAADRAFLRAPA